MPSTTKTPKTKEKFLVSASCSDPVGAGGEPPGETPAPRRELVQHLPDEVRRRLSDEVVDELLAGARTEQEIVGPGGLLADLTRRLVERGMDAELTEHLGYEPHVEPPGGAGNTRNGSTPKTLVTEHGPVRIGTPRDRDGSFEPKILRKHQRRFVSSKRRPPDWRCRRRRCRGPRSRGRRGKSAPRTPGRPSGCGSA